MSHFGKKKVHKAAAAPAASHEIASFVKSVRAGISEKEADYRRRSLALHPWVCAKCGRVFDEQSLSQLTVHHRDGNHNNNPPDGSNWENLCVYCHEDEHSRTVLAEYVADNEMDEASDGEASAGKGGGFGSMGAALSKFMEKKK
ncbi:MAG: YajD family HNH nuclease [Myxococcota bacterium]|jgi:hypothetical protein